MKAKELLGRIPQHRKEIVSINERIETLYAEAAGIKAIIYDKDRVQTSSTNKMEELFIRIDEEAEKWVKERLKLEREIRVRTEQIKGLDKPTHVEILYWRYIKCDQNGDPYPLEYIAYKMHLTYDRTRHLHGEALEAFRRKYL